jgi:CBS domain containing-hemolysin-like protein
VTTDDIWRELVGKVRADREGKGLLMERLGLGKWRLSAGVRLDDFRREYPALPDIPEVETMGGLLMTLLDKVPGPMESATLKGLRITAQVADERHVTEILAEVVK